MTIDVFKRYAALDPAKQHGMRPEWTAMEAIPLSTAHARGPNMQTQQQIPTQPRTPKPKRTGWLVVGAAFVLILIVGAAALFLDRSGTEVPPAETPTTSVVEQAIADPTITPSDALNTANAFYVTHNALDPAEVLALFSANATFSNNFTGTVTAEDNEMTLVWNVTQGTKLTSEGCRVTQTGPAQSLNVECVGMTRDALSRALSTPGVPTRVSMVITPEGIAHLEYRYSSPDFTVAGDPFIDWMTVHNPDDVEAAEFGSWTTVDEARATGLIRAQYAREWAEYLKQNRCTYLDGC